VTKWLTHESYGSPLSALSWVNLGGQNMGTITQPVSSPCGCCTRCSGLLI
jgi:hypothetical protein